MLNCDNYIKLIEFDKHIVKVKIWKYLDQLESDIFRVIFELNANRGKRL